MWVVCGMCGSACGVGCFSRLLVAFGFRHGFRALLADWRIVGVEDWSRGGRTVCRVFVGYFVGPYVGTMSGLCRDYVGILSDRTSVLRRDYVGIASGLCRGLCRTIRGLCRVPGQAKVA